MNARIKTSKPHSLIFTMGVHYRKLDSAVNSLAWLQGTVPYNQKFNIVRFIIEILHWLHALRESEV